MFTRVAGGLTHGHVALLFSSCVPCGVWCTTWGENLPFGMAQVYILIICEAFTVIHTCIISKVPKPNV